MSRFAVLLALCLIAACGQKGALYFAPPDATTDGESAERDAQTPGTRVSGFSRGGQASGTGGSGFSRDGRAETVATEVAPTVESKDQHDSGDKPDSAVDTADSAEHPETP